jgi:hypothetical protein
MNGHRRTVAAYPVGADIVAKVENRAMPKISRKRFFKTSLPLQYPLAPMRRSVVIFVQNNEVPHIASYEAHQWSQEISIVTPKRLLQQYLPVSDLCTATKSHYSITRSACARSVGGRSRPIAFAVFRLTISSNRLGRWIGRSPGLEPRAFLPARFLALPERHRERRRSVWEFCWYSAPSWTQMRHWPARRQCSRYRFLRYQCVQRRAGGSPARDIAYGLKT